MFKKIQIGIAMLVLTTMLFTTHAVDAACMKGTVGCKTITVKCIQGKCNKKVTVKSKKKKTTAKKQETTKNTSDSAKQNTTEESQYVQKIVELVNKERTQVGLSKVTLDNSLKNAAMTRAKEIVTSFSHTRPNGSAFSTVLAEQKISYRGAGENIAWGQATPEEVMQGWMNSSGHRANILNAKFTKIGVGYYKASNGRKYWSQLFIF